MTPTPLSAPRARLAAAYALWLGSMLLSFASSSGDPVGHAVFYAVTALPIGAMFITTLQYRWLVGASFYLIGFALSPFMGELSTLAFLLTAISLIELPIGYLLLHKWAGEGALSGSSQALVRFLISIGVLSLTSLIMSWGVFSALDTPRAHVSAMAVGLCRAVASLETLPFYFPGTVARPSKMSEYLAQVCLTLGVLVLLLLPIQTPTLALLFMPLMIWMALRSSYTQMMGVTALFSLISTLYIIGERGVFSDTNFGGPIPTADMLVLANTFVLVILSGAIPLSAIVAALRRTTQRATDEQKRLQRVVESATGIMIVTMDQAGRVTRFSPGATRILGFTEGEVRHGRAALIPQAQRAEIMARYGLDPHSTFADLVSTLLEKKPHDPIVSVTPMTHRDGTTRVLATTTTPIRGANGEVLEYLTTADDVTERVSTENALRKALKTEQHASERLAHIDQLKTELVSTVSHELRTPIASIIGYTEVLIDRVAGDLNQDQRQMLGSIDRSSRRLMRLVDDLLTVSHIEDTTISLSLSNFTVASLIEALTDAMAPLFQQADVSLQVAPFDEELSLDADFNHVFRMLTNLLSNAAKFSHKGEQVYLSVGSNDSSLTIKIVDTGIGIPREDQEQLFSRFFRAHNAYENQIPGTGLGLYITSQIAKQHGGEVTVDSKLGQGTAFTVCLPLRHHGTLPASAASR